MARKVTVDLTQASQPLLWISPVWGYEEGQWVLRVAVAFKDPRATRPAILDLEATIAARDQLDQLIAQHPKIQEEAKIVTEEAKRWDWNRLQQAELLDIPTSRR